MSNDFNFEALIEQLAERLAAKLRAGLFQSGSAPALRPRLLTVEHGAIYLGRTEDAVRHLIASGKLPVVRLDKRTFLDINDLDDLIRRNKHGGDI